MDAPDKPGHDDFLTCHEEMFMPPRSVPIPVPKPYAPTLSLINYGQPEDARSALAERGLLGSWENLDVNPTNVSPWGIAAGAISSPGALVKKKSLGIKEKTLGTKTSYTSPASIAARQTAWLVSRRIPEFPTPTLGSRSAKARKLAVLAGRAGPLLGLLPLAADLYFSDDKVRSLAGNAGGLIGGSFGAGMLIPAGPLGIATGAILGSAAGNEAGLAAYDSIKSWKTKLGSGE